MIGRQIVSGSQAVIDHYGLDADAHSVGMAIAARVLDMVKSEGVNWRPGAYDLLQHLNEWKVPYSLVTSSYAEYASRVAALAPGCGFADMVTGDMVHRGKPDPEPYSQAAQRLGVDPSNCVAFEDAESGVLSAYYAGVRTVAVPNQTPIPDKPGITIVHSLEDADRAFFASLMSKPYVNPSCCM